MGHCLSRESATFGAPPLLGVQGWLKGSLLFGEQATSTLLPPGVQGTTAPPGTMDAAPPPQLWNLPLLLVGSALGLASVSAQGNNLEICLLPLDVGPCQAFIPKFYYDRNQQKCRRFKYGGCLGNANNFPSRELCEHTCGNIEKVPRVCRLELRAYPCDKPHIQFFFNMKTMRCEPLGPGVCSKSMNVFSEEATCKDLCEPRKSIPSFCSSPADEGLCSANVTRYYFNSRNKTCETFTYTGCGGNENNFSYLDSCERACIKGWKKPKRKKIGYFQPRFRKLHS